MLYFFTGNSEYLIKEQIQAWKKKFTSKFSDFNMIDIKTLMDIDKSFLIRNLTAVSFGGEKKLIIINCKIENGEMLGDFLIDILDKIPKNNIVLFYIIEPDKRSRLYKMLKEKCETRDYNIIEPHDIKKIIQNKYNTHINGNAIDTLIQYKAGNLRKIISEIEKLRITKEYISTKDVVEHIIPECEESIFQVVNDILGKNIIDALLKINIIINDINIYGFYNSLLANLRTIVYIGQYKKMKIKPLDISLELHLGNRSFLVNKQYIISYNVLKNLYIGLIKLDKKMKTGKCIGNEEKVFKVEIERLLIQVA